jgi:hypothetical protein
MYGSGATLEEGTGATMSEDEDEGPPIMEVAAMEMSSNGHDMMGFGPLVHTDTERSLMERVRQELKIELKQVQTCVRARINGHAKVFHSKVLLYMDIQKH